MALTKILDKLVQIGPGYLDQNLRTYITENREYRFYTDTVNNKSYAVVAFFTSGSLVLRESKKADILMVAGGGGSSIGNLSGGSGAGEVVMIEDAMLPAEEFTITVGAGGAGATVSSWSDQYTVIGEALGSVGSDSSFEVTLGGTNKIIAKGGGVGGYARLETTGLIGGSGGGGGAAELDTVSKALVPTYSPTPPTGYGEGMANTSDPSVITAILNNPGGYLSGNVYSYGNEGGYSDPWVYDPTYSPPGAVSSYTYHPGGGGGAGQVGGGGDDTKGGNGGDGISIPWVNEVFKEVYHFNGDIYWGGGGGGAAASNEEPGNGGLGGGGGGASIRNSAVSSWDDLNTDQKIYYNGKGGKQGITLGFDADKLLGGAGGKNTGGGAGGSHNVSNVVTGYQPNTQGNNGGSGFVLIRIHLDDAFNPYSASL